MTTESEQDKLLISEANNVLVFPTIAKLKSYVRESLHFLPDSENFAEWIDHYKTDTPYTVNDIDAVRRSIMNFESITTLSGEDAQTRSIYLI